MDILGDIKVEKGNLFHIFDDSANNLRLSLPSPKLFPNKSFLKEQFRISLEKNAGDIAVLEKNISRYKLVDSYGTEITIDQLLDRYFTNPYDCFIEDIREENNIISLPDVRSILSEIPKNDIEEKYYYSCYYCDSFQQTNSKDDYESHIINKHGLGHPCYPCKADLERLGLKAQGKSWEI